MWLPWARPTVPSRSPTPSLSLSPFAFTTFKDVQSLFSDDPDNDSPLPHHPSCCSPTVLLCRPIPASSSILRTLSFPFLSPDPRPPLPHDRIVIYFTGLGIVRPTHEACTSILSILRCFRVKLDERDVSMDSAFLAELQRLLGGQEKWSLPRVFLGGKYIGGAEEVKRLHEIGELKELVQDLPPADPEVCETCGGYSFVLCRTCHGSHKMFADKTGFRSCTVCNENGLVMCPSCHSSPL